MNNIEDRINHYEQALQSLGEESEYVFLDSEIVTEIHDDLIDRFGGSYGVRDEDGLQSAVNAPMMTDNYTDQASVSDVTASLVYRLVNNHPYVDGNKRTALMALDLMTYANGMELTVQGTDLRNIILETADGTLSEDQLADWIQRNSRPRSMEQTKSESSTDTTLGM